MTADDVVGIVVGLVLVAFFLFALLFPERF